MSEGNKKSGKTVESPHYSSYSLEELYECYNDIDKDANPDRVKEILAEINLRKQSQEKERIDLKSIIQEDHPFFDSNNTLHQVENDKNPSNGSEPLGATYSNEDGFPLPFCLKQSLNAKAHIINLMLVFTFLFIFFISDNLINKIIFLAPIIVVLYAYLSPGYVCITSNYIELKGLLGIKKIKIEDIQRISYSYNIIRGLYLMPYLDIQYKDGDKIENSSLIIYEEFYSNLDFDKFRLTIHFLTTKPLEDSHTHSKISTEDNHTFSSKKKEWEKEHHKGLIVYFFLGLKSVIMIFLPPWLIEYFYYNKYFSPDSYLIFFDQKSYFILLPLIIALVFFNLLFYLIMDFYNKAIKIRYEIIPLLITLILFIGISFNFNTCTIIKEDGIVQLQNNSYNFDYNWTDVDYAKTEVSPNKEFFNYYLKMKDDTIVNLPVKSDDFRYNKLNQINRLLEKKHIMLHKDYLTEAQYYNFVRKYTQNFGAYTGDVLKELFDIK